jgi:sialate O-acetylesterase
MSRKYYIEIEEGVSPYQVVQRGPDDRADVRFAGSTTVPNGTPIEARLLRYGKPTARFPWEEVGKVAHGSFTGLLPAVPTGGEYALEVRAAGRGEPLATTACPGLLVGDLWVMAGQSNMEGCGRLDAPDIEEPNTLVHAFDMSDRWLTACEPLHWRLDSPDPAHWPELRKPTPDEVMAQHKGRTNGVGPGMSFAGEIVRHTGVPIGLIPCAVGGTTMDQWDPEQVKLGGKSLYGAMLRRVDAVGGHVRGLLWYQGESDAVGGVSNVFAAKFSRFVQAVRHDFSQADLPVLFVQIGRVVVPQLTHPEWNAIQETQRVCAREIAYTDVVPAVDLAMEDFIHLSSAGQKRLGERLAAVALRRCYGWENLKVGPRLDAVEAKADGTVRVRYGEVNSRLLPEDEISGFSIRDIEGGDLCLIYSALVDPKAPDTVVLRLKERPSSGSCLWYGFGPAPFCNLTDELDMGAPVFGPRLLKSE